jgi:GTP-binding protein
MHIKSAKFIKGVVADDSILRDGKPHIAFIGRSNVGKSTLINSLTLQKKLAKISSFPGRTQEINIFLINDSLYLVDLPGYGYVKGPKQLQERLHNLIYWYLLDSKYEQKKVVLIIDAKVGLTDSDKAMLYSLNEKGKDVVIVANKIDKIGPSVRATQLQNIQDAVGDQKIIPYSSKSKIGVSELLKEIF